MLKVEVVLNVCKIVNAFGAKLINIVTFFNKILFQKSIMKYVLLAQLICNHQKLPQLYLKLNKYAMNNIDLLYLFYLTQIFYLF